MNTYAHAYTNSVSMLPLEKRSLSANITEMQISITISRTVIITSLFQLPIEFTSKKDYSKKQLFKKSNKNLNKIAL